jgi:hypothetical protein
LVVGSQYLHKAELYYLLQENLPLPGAYVVEVIYPGNVDSVSAGAVSLFNVAQQPAEAVAIGSERCSQTISTDITTVTDGAWVIDVVGCGTGGSFCAIADGMEGRWTVSEDICGFSAACSTKAVASSGLICMSWQHSKVDQLVHSLAAFAPTQCPIGDINGDCFVDWQDLMVLAERWLELGATADLDGKNGVNMLDFALIADNWLFLIPHLTP